MSHSSARKLSKREIRALVAQKPYYEDKIAMLASALVVLAGSGSLALHALMMH